ncbi:MAG: hypothetical protein JST92_25095 [Deltaproteobacteria bacterium]|nr:hypothetical protein [Deltaproteobacteria bacterium]
MSGLTPVPSLAILHQARLLAPDIPQAHEYLLSIADVCAARLKALRRPSSPPILAVLTYAASAGLIEACDRRGLALIDTRGTVIVHAGQTFVRVVGKDKSARPSDVPLFANRATRLIRFFLSRPFRPFTARAAALATQVSYAYAHGVLVGLQREGLLLRTSPRAGFVAHQPARLLSAWILASAHQPLEADAWNAPSTSPAALDRARLAWESSNQRGVFTLASGLLPQEVFATALPHACYLSGDVRPVVSALQLRKTTPSNFLILRPSPSEATDAFGLYAGNRTLDYGLGVSLPQLAVDLARLGGRGRDQSDALVETFTASLAKSAASDG